MLRLNPEHLMTRQAHFALLMFILVPGCAKHAPLTGPMPLEQAMKLIDARASWTSFSPINIPRHPAEKHLAGMTIVLDPGHGGDAAKPNWKRGPTGVREAEMNLRVSLLLKRLLQDAGANVILTRESDTDLDLSDRAAIANSAIRPDGGTGADLFISIHHNAGGGPTTNYTSIWYHGQVDDNEPDLDAARYVAHALGRHIRTQVAKTSPVLSSHLMYDSGFGVLRACHVPAILCECSFYSDPVEEQRLRDAGYNLREAYAIYEGLCEYAYCGRPTQSTPKSESSTQGIRLTTTLNDGLPSWWGSNFNRIVTSTVTVTLDDKRIAFNYDKASKRITATLPPDVTAGDHVLWIHHANMFKNHNWPQRYTVQVNRDDRGVQAWIVDTLPAARPTLPSTQPAATRSTTRRIRG